MKEYRTYLCEVDETLVPAPCTAGGPDHEPHPTGYVAYGEWAEKKLKTHRCQQCPHCHLYGLWMPR